MASDTAPAVLTIKVENVSAKGGLVQIALYDRNSYDGHGQMPVASLAVEAHAPETVVTLPSVKPGVYAVKMFQDIGKTGAFATSALGLPEEPYGFSNDAPPLFDQPSFDATKFNLINGENRIVVHLRSLF